MDSVKARRLAAGLFHLAPKRPNQVLTRKPGAPLSATVGTSGSPAIRARVPQRG